MLKFGNLRERKKGERSSTEEYESIVISSPQSVVHKSHVNHEFQWSWDQQTKPKEVFSLDTKIGEGSFGVVYKAIHKESKSILAIKVLNMTAEDASNDEIQRELDVLKKCNHPNCVSYYGSCWDTSDLWIIMEYCSLGSLCDVMEVNNKTLSEKQIAYVCKEVLKGLDYLHTEMSVIHMDIKGGNILMNERGQIKLADFGVSEHIISTMVSENIIGTPHYLAPECVKDSKYSFKADIWAFGITVIELADGNPPNADIHPMRLIYMIPSRQTPTVENSSQFSPEFIQFLSRCLNKEYHQRPSAKELLQDPFIVSAPGPEIMRPIIITCLEKKEQKRGDRNSSLKSQLKSFLNRKVKRSKSVDNISLPGTKNIPQTTQQSNRDSGTMLFDEEYNGTFVKKSELGTNDVPEILKAKPTAQSAPTTPTALRQTTATTLIKKESVVVARHTTQKEEQKVQTAQQTQNKAIAPPPAIPPPNKQKPLIGLVLLMLFLLFCVYMLPEDE